MSTEQSLVKCLIWDLDDTLWTGTLLEDPEVRLAPAMREVVDTLDSRGILQSIASKNNHDQAWSRLEEIGISEYFILPEIGWGPKSDAVRRIADRLTFAHAAIAFIDDQPSERAEVAFHLPEVRCYRADQALSLPGAPEFSPPTVTVDSRKRRLMYKANFQREAAKESFGGPDEEFLRSLDLEMNIGRADDENLSRVEELTLRTSQMNATGVHYPDAVLRGLLADPSHEVLTVTMADRFGAHGAVGVLLLEFHRSVWHLRLLATSCRVVSFGAGSAILTWLIDQAAQAHAHLAADFRATDRNRMMEVAYRFAGFTDESCECLSVLGPAAEEVGIRHMHVVPDRRDPPAAMRLTAPDLAVKSGSR
jgi:methoxymalonate biosynthesis protein